MGSGFFAELDGDWIDAGLAGQQAFSHMIEPLLRPITFNDEQMAAIWRPASGVWINPNIQTGTPCVDGRRVPTPMVAELVEAGGDDETSIIKEIGNDYLLSETQVRQALDYELTLAA
ncbi:DUF433 domain-containing protein [Candidatus Poriferisodalis sp.]|uniref:DUF433 domain-containing protein n=1 Tax=Candidatus Poriferisodalis sp. TaxID=3101277 RepID=UPI003B026BCF